jgi:hypothetical protein
VTSRETAALRPGPPKRAGVTNQKLKPTGSPTHVSRCPKRILSHAIAADDRVILHRAALWLSGQTGRVHHAAKV